MKKLLLCCAAMLAVLTCSAQKITIKKGDQVLATYDGKDTEVIFESSDPYNGHAYVDLGLSVKWATCNVGASQPEEYGDYFAWGEIEPYYTEGHSQDRPCSNWRSGKSAGYDWASYKWCKGSFEKLKKYSTSSGYGTVDNKTVLDSEDDAAHVNWGGVWRMPTYEEMKELCEKCTWTKKYDNNAKFIGYDVTSKVTGYTDKSIFLPNAGFRTNSRLDNAGSCGYYWSSSLYYNRSSDAYELSFDPGTKGQYGASRCSGLSVRAVCM